MSSKVGHYELLAEFASGGMSSVHFGRLIRPGGFVKTVVIKRLKAHLARDPAFVEMLLHEARVTGIVEHPNVVSTLDVVTTDGDVFVVMEYVKGESLARILAKLRARGETAPPRMIAAILGGVLHGLHAAHEAKDGDRPLGIVHRDVSPQNVLVGLDGIARIADFGVAKSAATMVSSAMEPAGQVVGKVAYLAPEVVKGETATALTDVYSTGIVLWEALTGARLFTGEHKADILDAVMTYTAPPPSRKVPAVPPALDDVTLRALERDPKRRFSTAHEMAIALESAVPPALPSEVAAWVGPLVASDVDSRNVLFAETTEREAVLTFAATSTIPLSMEERGDGAKVVVTERLAAPAAPARTRAGGIVPWIAGLVVAAALAVGVGLAVRAPSPSAASATEAARPVESAPPLVAEPPPAVSAPPAPSPSPAASAASSRAVRRFTRPAHAASTPRPSGSIDCSKKFTIDGEGHTIFRKECL